MKKIIIFVVLIIVLIGGYFVIKRYKSVDGEGFIKKDVIYEKYNKGDKVDFYDDSWYVLYDSDEKTDYVTLISNKISYYEEIPEIVNGIYETSDVNEFLKGKLTEEYGKDNLVEKNGYSVRLFNQDDMRELLDVEYDEKNDSYKIIDCPNYICLNYTYFGTMIDTNSNFEKVDVYSNIEDIGDKEEYLLHAKYYNLVGDENNYYLESIVDDTTLFLRPVINVYKSSLIDENPYDYENFGE